MSCAWGLVLTLFLRVSAGTVTASISWPKGLYGLLKPTTGCPTGWSGKGWVFQDTEDDNPSNERSETLHMDGFVVPSNVLKYFCIKTAGTPQGPNWPKGQYCVYRRAGKMLGGMQWGVIRMHDENDSGGYKDTQALTYSILRVYAGTPKYTEFYFYCQTKGNKKIPISLPITKPFYLLPYGSRDCQQVKWMVATTEWIKYYTRDNSDANVKHRTVPHVNLGNTNSDGVTMYYCYYQSCRYTLVNKRGVFQSPGFPGKYPDGQLCSWTIMVPDNHTVLVYFTNFSLNGSNVDDYLRFYMKINATYRLNETFYGVRPPFNVTASSEVKFLFHSNEESNSFGFRAEYHVFTQLGDYTERPYLYTGTSTPQASPSELSTIHSTMQASAKPAVGNCSSDNGVDKESHSLDQTRTITAIIVPLAFVAIGFLLVIVILYRCRLKQRRCDTCGARESKSLKQHNSTSVSTPLSRDAQEYESPVKLKNKERSTTHTDLDINHECPEYHVLEPISNVVRDNDGQTYQTLSRDQPEYEAPNYSKHARDSDVDVGAPEYHVLEPLDNNVPDVVYQVLEGPDSNNGPSGDQMYQALDKETTQNPLSQSTSPATMATENPLYV